jgi:hypothetical protein
VKQALISKYRSVLKKSQSAKTFGPFLYLSEAFHAAWMIAGEDNVMILVGLSCASRYPCSLWVLSRAIYVDRVLATVLLVSNRYS